jgi:uncharacterized protein (TIGR03435 family)
VTANLLANHLWQSTIAAGVAGLLTMALRRNSAAARYGVWLAASLKFLVPFALLVSAGSHLGLRTVEIPSKPQVAFVMDTIGHPFSVPATRVARTSALTGFAMSSATVLGSLTAIWLIGVVAVLVRWGVRWRRVVAIVHAGAPAEGGSVLNTLRRLEDRTGAVRPLTLVLSDTSLEPGVFGILRPVLVWPPRIAEHLADTHIEAILAHELAHVRRRDNLAAASHMLVQALFWFHPLVWWIGSRLVDERERACDEAVVRLGSEPQTYAESILKICQFYVESPLACVAGVTGSNLKKRIEHIMTPRSCATLTVWKRVLLATTAAAAILGPVSVGALNAPSLRAQSTAVDATNAPAFDVTSVKPNNSGNGRIMMVPVPGGGWNASNVTLGMLIRIAHQLQDNQIVGGPKWLFADRYDVLGKGSAPGREAFLPKLQNLLADRFGLVVHTEKRELPMYALVLARRDGRIGPKLAPSTADCTPPAPPPGGPGEPPPPRPFITLAPGERPRCGFRIGPGSIMAGGSPLSSLATNLSRLVGSVVVDKTGLAGTFDWTLEFAPDPNMAGRDDLPQPPPGVGPERPASDGPSIFSALQEQLGLKLDSTKGPVDVVVIDRAEKPTAN